MSHFEDHFSQQALDYALYRPTYPEALFTYLASLVPNHHLAWDCGTGSGQAAVGLASHFAHVVATDASAEQISNAYAQKGVEYRVEPAEEPGLVANSVDLVTVAIAVHWFNLERFYHAVRQVTVPQGILAVWTYHLPVIDPAVDAIVYHYYKEVVAEYWPELWRYVDEQYQTLPFPFAEIIPPPFDIKAEWNLEQLAGFLSSWSASKKYQAARGQHPLNAIWPDLVQAWGVPTQARKIRWPLFLRTGRVHA